MLTNSATTFDWVGYGFKLTVPPDSLPIGVNQCQLDIVASIAGQYQFPEKFQQLVSGVFWIRPSVLSQFRRSLTIEIEHCAKMTSSTKLSFVRAHCTQESLPYRFKEVKERGFFQQTSSYENRSYGSLEVTQFSCFAVADNDDDVERRYTACVYYLERYTFHVAISWNTETHYQVTTSLHAFMNVCTLNSYIHL